MSGILDLARASFADGQRPLSTLPVTIETPARQWSFGLHIPTTLVRPSPLRIAFRLGGLSGRIRIGVLDDTHYDFAVCAEFADAETISGELRLPADATTGALVAQNLLPDTPTRFELLSLEASIDPPYPGAQAAPLDEYMRSGFEAIEGWCHPLHVAFIRGMDEVLFAHGVDGAVGEIGVHHGKHMIALHNLMRPGLCSVAIDVFGDAQFNLDRSGAGDQAVFQANMAQWAAHPQDCLVLRRDSLVLREPDWAEIAARTGPLKFFSIDGCHEVEHTLADIRTAIRLLAHGGVIMVDDYLNQDFPGVHQAIAWLFLHDRPPIAPFAMGQDKIYLTHVSHHAAYVKAAQRVMRGMPETSAVKHVRLYGYPVLSWRTAP